MDEDMIIFDKVILKPRRFCRPNIILKQKKDKLNLKIGDEPDFIKLILIAKIKKNREVSLYFLMVNFLLTTSFP